MKYLLKVLVVFMNKKFWYLTKLSLNKKIKTKWFYITNIILAIAITLLVNISSIIEFFGGDFERETNIIVVDNTNNSFEIFLNNMSLNDNLEDITITKSNENIDTLKENLKENDLLVVINSDSVEYLKAEVISENAIDSLTYQVIIQALNSTKTTVGMISENIDPSMLANLSQNITVDRVILNEEAKTDENMNLVMSSIFPTLILPFFMLIIFLVQMVGGEICEEKTTRSMEIIISNVSPKMHLLSKIIASNIFVIVQGLLLILYVLIAFLISDSLGSVSNIIDFGGIMNTLSDSGLIDKLWIIIPITLIMILLSFIAYSIVAGILASMTVNIEDFNQLQTPIMLISMAGYYLSIMAAMFDGSLFIRIISYLPFLSVFISPTLFILGQITVVDMLISVVILILFVWILLKSGLKVYKVGILNYSSGNVWKKFASAFKKSE